MLIICKAKAQQDKLILVLGIWYKSEEVRDDPSLGKFWDYN